MNVAWRSTAQAGTGIGALVVYFLLSSVQPLAQEVNTVKSVRSVGSTVEIEVESSKEFPVRDEVVVLRIGTQEFSRSKTPQGGSLKRLIFILSGKDFEQLADSVEMTVTYGRQGDDDVSAASSRRSHEPRWNFGRLDKSLLDR